MCFDSITLFHCPRWEELPGLELYLDQVLLVVNESLEPLYYNDGGPVTATMVNNYVKQKVLEPSVKKKYGRSHLARLIMISLLKRALSIAEIAAVLELETEKRDISAVYDDFCTELEERLRGCVSAEGGVSAPTNPFSAAVEALVGKLIFECIMHAGSGKTD